MSCSPEVEQAEHSQLSESGPSGGSPTQALCIHVEQWSHSVIASPSSSVAPQTHFTFTPHRRSPCATELPDMPHLFCTIRCEHAPRQQISQTSTVHVITAVI